MTTAQAAKSPGLTGWHALAMIVGFFAVVMTVDGAFTVLALRTHPGQVSVTPYEDGLLYNQRIAQLAAQDRLGWQAGAAAATDKVIFEMRDRDGRPVRGLTVTGKLERPATEVGRVTPRFAEVAPGRYEASTRGLAGTWDLTATASDRQGRIFVAERRLTWP
jgi:nitrogen fixation protein FixH